MSRVKKAEGGERGLNYMPPVLHIVALFVKVPAYGTEALLERANQRGMEGEVVRGRGFEPLRHFWH